MFRRRRISPAVAFLVAGICFLVGSGFSIHRLYFLHGAVRASGTIVELRVSKDKEGSTSYSPTFVFRDTAGAEHRIDSNLYQRPAGYAKGDSVSVLYRPGNPTSAQIDRVMELWFVPILLGALAIVWTVIGFIAALRH